MGEVSHERALLRACRRGDEAAARSLHARLTPALMAYARSIVRDAAMAEDVAQSTMCRLFGLPVAAIDGVADPRAWLLAIARREALNALRADGRLRRRERRAATDGRGSAAADGERLAPADGVGEAVDALPRRLREVVVLKHVLGLTFDQVGEALGINRNTAASRHRVAVERLRRALGVEAASEVGSG